MFIWLREKKDENVHVNAKYPILYVVNYILFKMN